MTTGSRLDRIDKQLAAIRTLMTTGTRLVVASRQDIRLLAADLRKLAALQAKTDANLNGLISALRKGGGNGHSKAKVDLQ